MRKTSAQLDIAPEDQECLINDSESAEAYTLYSSYYTVMIIMVFDIRCFKPNIHHTILGLVYHFFDGYSYCVFHLPISEAVCLTFQGYSPFHMLSIGL